MKTRRHLALIIGGLAGVIATLFITNTLFDGSAEKMTGTTNWQNILLVNIMVGGCIVLFVAELKRQAIRVLLTVIVALILGFIVTFIFNLDAAERFGRGEFRVQVVSAAEGVEDADVDLQYNKRRGGEFNKPKVVAPVSEINWSFAGREGDVVSLLAYAKNRRSDVDVLIELRDGNGATLASATSATQLQVDETFDDLVSVKDAVIEDYRLPADGVYTLHSRPEDIETATVLAEAMSQSQLAFEALLLGPIERVNRWGSWIQDAITLILLGLSFAIVFRAQQFSLGAEGQLYFGALISGVIALNSPHIPGVLLIPFIILASGTAGFIYGLIPGALKAYLGANELVSTLMLNVIATRFFEMVLNLQLKPPGRRICRQRQVHFQRHPACHRRQDAGDDRGVHCGGGHLHLVAADTADAPGLRDPHHRQQPQVRGLRRRQFTAHDHAGDGDQRHRGWLGGHAFGDRHPPAADTQYLAGAGIRGRGCGFAGAFECAGRAIHRLAVRLSAHGRAIHGARRQCELRGGAHHSSDHHPADHGGSAGDLLPGATETG